MDYNYDYSYVDATGNLDSSFFAMIAGFSTVMIIFALAVCIFTMIIMWKIFTKAGEEGWKSLIPVYNAYIFCKITWGNGWYFLLAFLTIIPVVGYIVFFVFYIITLSKLSKAFGKSGGFTVGLVFLNTIFLAILAFDDSKYLGVSSVKAQQPIQQQYVSNQVPYTVQNPKPSVDESFSFCSKCGTKLNSDAIFCPNCGTQKVKLD